MAYAVVVPVERITTTNGPKKRPRLVQVVSVGGILLLRVELGPLVVSGTVGRVDPNAESAGPPTKVSF